METLLKFLWDFVLMFLLVAIVYLVFINKKRKEYSKLNKNDVIHLFIARYNLDMRKIKYKDVLFTLSLINSFILAFGATVVINIKSVVWSIVYSLLLCIILIYSLYEITGRYFKKKEGKENV